MFKKYGEFNSAEEINTAAATAMEQGDLEAVKELALENGIDEEDAQDYIDGCTFELCTPLMAAAGKIKIEKEAFNDLPSTFEGWLSIINDMMTNEDDVCAGIRKKGKRIEELFGTLLKLSSKNRRLVPDAITKAAGIKEKVYVGDVDIITFKQTVRDYYTK